jgi:hypothetical protein
MALWVNSRTPALLAPSMRQSTMLAESSVTGNILPSLSVFVATPRSLNQATVSAGPKRWRGPIISLEPRG